MAKQTGLSGWGRTFVPGREVRSENLPAITRSAVLTRGLGRSYGDASLPPAHTTEVAGSALADRVLGFDPETGVLRAEAGLVLSDMNRLFLPRGFFTPVTPGTRFVTLGGMVASDVHGKNHHVDGTIGRHVQRLLLQLANGRTVECSRDHEPELFLATLGGMGLTGHILEVQLKLQKVPSAWIYRESFRLDDLDALLAKLKEAGKEWPFTVAWIDTIATGKQLGRGILYCGRWAEPGEAPDHLPKPQKQKIAMPFPLPSGLLNRFTIAMFNRLVYYAHNKPHKQDVVDPDTFFYPLDTVRQWNLAYGARGVTQHQSVIPDEAGAQGIRQLIELLAQTGASSFLSVIKDCGPEGEGLLSFPRPGMSLALDIPITSNTQDVIDQLNKHVLACGGRIYLTKDGFTRREDFRAMEPRLARFLAVKEKWDPEHHIHSALSDRLFGPPQASDESIDEEQVERASKAFARAEYEREERARAERIAATHAATDVAAAGVRPPVDLSATVAGVGPEALAHAAPSAEPVAAAAAEVGPIGGALASAFMAPMFTASSTETDSAPVDPAAVEPAPPPAEAAAPTPAAPDAPPAAGEAPTAAPSATARAFTAPGAAAPSDTARGLFAPSGTAPAFTAPGAAAPSDTARGFAAPDAAVPPVVAPAPAAPEPASAPAASEPPSTIESAPPIAVGTPEPEPEPAPRSEAVAHEVDATRATDPAFGTRQERTLVGPGPLTTPPEASDADESLELDDADAEPSVPPPVPAAASSSRPPATPIPPPAVRMSVPPPPPRTLEAVAAAISSVPPKRLTVPPPPPPSTPTPPAPEIVPAVEVMAAVGVAPVAPAPAAPEPPPVLARTPSGRPLAPFSSKSTLVGIPALTVPGQPAAKPASEETPADGARKEDENA